MDSPMMEVARADLLKLLEENRLLLQQVTLVQENNTKLVEQRRELKRLLKTANAQHDGCQFCDDHGPVSFGHSENCSYRKAMEMT